MSKFNTRLKQWLKICLLLMAGILLSIPVHAQQITVTGTVEDHQGETLPGVNVRIKGTTRGAVTSVDGKFSIQVPDEEAVLQISFVGYSSQEIVVGNQRVINVTLLESATSMEEVVVIGYGSMVRKNLTGSVGSISGVALERVPVASAAEALAGKVAGVMVSAVDGEPGSEINIRIRGGNSITQSNQPLFIVDGFPADNINDIPPTDIMSIDILKDASLTAIYGARGGNGVVVVTTKAARAGKISVNYNHTTQIRTLARPIEMMDPYEYVKMQYEANNSHWSISGAFRKNFGSQYDLDLYKGFEGNDWQNEILGGNPMSFMHNLTIGGGSEKIRFNTSITYNDENGVLEGSGVTRTSVNTKINIDATPTLRIMLNPRINFRRNMGAGADAVGNGGIIDVLRYRPTNGLRDFGHYKPGVIDAIEEEVFVYENPRDRIKQNYKLENLNTYSNQASIEWTPIKGLTLRTDGMLGIRFVDENLYWGSVSKEGLENNNLPLARITSKKRNEYTWQNVASYTFSLNKNNFSVLAGQEIRHVQDREYQQSARYFPKDISAEKALQNMALGEAWKKPSSSISSPDRLARFFGQISYDFDGKYLLQGTFSADASTKFAPDNRWGYFPAISGGWVVSQEDFMKNQNLISFLKIRAGIGMTGNNRIDDDMWRYQYNLGSGVGPGWNELKPDGYEYYTNTGGSVFPNAGIKWETAISRSAALDIGLFGGRLNITPEIYLNTVKDLLYKSNINTTTGYNAQMQNIAQVTNRGWELSIEGTIIENRDYYLRGQFNIGYNKRVIDKLNGEERELWFTHGKWKSDWSNDFCLKVGEDVGLIYGFVFDGLYTIDEFNRNVSGGYTWEDRKDPGLVDCRELFGAEPGRPKFKNMTNFKGGEDDYNVINEHDRVVIGNTTPKAQGGFGLSGGWKDFDFSCNFIFMLGFDVNNATRYELSSLQGNATNFFNVTTEFNGDKRWRYIDDNSIPLTGDAYVETNANRTLWHPNAITKKVTFDYFIEDGSFLRVQDITLGYTLPKDLTRKFYVERLRVYFSGYNLFLFTNYKGYDPEVDVMSGLTPCVDFNKYPRSRNFVFGLNLSF